MSVFASKFGKGQRGIAIVYLTIALFIIVALTVLGVDVAYVWTVKSELQFAVDAACLAGTNGLVTSPAQARAQAKAAALTNKVNGQGLVLQDSDIILGTWDTSTKTFTALSAANESQANAVRISGRLLNSRGSAMKLVFASAFGFNTKEMTIAATAGFGSAADIVIVQDITSSFSTELSKAKQGDQAFIDSLYSNGTGRAHIGIAAFTGWGKTISLLKQINTNYSALTNSVTSLKLCGNTGMPVCSGTDIAAGIDQGIAIFNDTTAPSTSTQGKAMVIVGDGEPNQDSDGSHPTYSNAQLLTLAQQRSDAAWSQSIHVYVVFYNPTNDATASANMKSLIRGKGVYVSVSDPNQLPTALAAISKQLARGLLE